MSKVILASVLGVLGAVSERPAPVRADANAEGGSGYAARELLEELVAFDTSEAGGESLEAIASIAARLRQAGFPARDAQVLAPSPGLGHLVARLRGKDTGRRPLMLMAHIDVVPARREDWSVDPFRLLEREGFLYGRGTTDNKAGVAILVTNLVRYKQEGFVPGRDLIVVVTSDEETTGAGIQWLLSRHRPLVDASYALNTDAGGGILKAGKPSTFSVQAAEKLYVTYELEVTNRGGHSSLPEADNAIYRLSAALVRLAGWRFPIRLNEVTRAYFERSARQETGQVAEDMVALSTAASAEAAARLSNTPLYNALIRTTCVATRLDAGHADNALPQKARATVNCRVVPGDPPDDVERTLRTVLADDQIRLRRTYEPVPSPPSPLDAEVLAVVERLSGEMWPGVLVVPEMSASATDGLFVRNAGIPTYGVSALFEEIGDVRAHGADERVGVVAFDEAREFWYRLVKDLASGPSTRD